MASAPPKDRMALILGGLSAALVAAVWYYALKLAPTEQHQGEVYRIIYMHVPSAFLAFTSAFALLGLSIWTLITRNPVAALWARASAEVGLLFTILTLVTGSIWGRPTWGVWWVWDARLTTTLILALLYAGYLIMQQSLSPGPQRDRIAAVLGVIIVLDIPIIYMSVTWWRTLHQPPSLMREGGSTMDPEMQAVLYTSFFAMLMFAVWLGWLRRGNLGLKEKIEQLSYQS